MELDFEMNSNAVMDAMMNGFADEAPTERNSDDNGSDLFRKEGEKYRPSDSGVDPDIDYGFHEYDEASNALFHSDDEYEGESPDYVEDYEEQVPTSFLDYDDDYELELFAGDTGEMVKATKGKLVEAYNQRETTEALSKIIMGAGQTMVQYENAVREQLEGNIFISEQNIAAYRRKLSDPHIGDSERGRIYKAIEEEQRSLDYVHHHIDKFKAEREAALAAANKAKISAVSNAMLNNYRWDNDTMMNVDKYLASNISNYNADMLSPELLVIARKAMEHDMKKGSEIKDSIKNVRTSGNTINARKAATDKANNNARNAAARKLAQGQLSTGDMFQFLSD
ncbi:hypothetical protein [Klebsiella aerogenes]|uniref:hypothetical protein n=1 Tax=Klebsiella aerogenes TaxID=548 RepID=UPI002D7F4508|nr:hypothetical protein [Klebsiella aerogenes]